MRSFVRQVASAASNFRPLRSFLTDSAVNYIDEILAVLL
jgi:hypothetical protein